jgi:beta-phosphoglucomutase-like phosphatase (HAD superfamily)
MYSKTLKSKGFLFDMDGTLIDTTPQVIKFWTDIAIAHNIDPAKVCIVLSHNVSYLMQISIRSLLHRMVEKLLKL